MNKSSLITIILILASIFSWPTFGMIIKNKSAFIQVREILELCEQITSQITKEDLTDMRLVCKEWASKGESWKFMPDSVEQKYDKKIKQKEIFRKIDKDIILFDLVSENNIEGVQWIINSQQKLTGLELKSIKSTLYPSMYAIHNKDPEMARLLIESEQHSKIRQWKRFYHKMKVPKGIEECLYTGINRDFSFLQYLIAVWSDKADTLKKLYKQKNPTEIGETVLLKQCLEDNAHHCFSFFLKNEKSKEIIRKNVGTFFIGAIDTHRKEIPTKIIKEKLFSLNQPLNNQNKTILDVYYEEIKDAKAIALLLDLGAKKWTDL